MAYTNGNGNGGYTTLDDDTLDIPIGRDVLRVSLKQRDKDGALFMDVRRWYYAEDDTLRPTQKGWQVPIDKAGEVRDAISNAVSAAMNIIDHDGFDDEPPTNGATAKRAPRKATAAKKAAPRRRATAKKA